MNVEDIRTVLIVGSGGRESAFAWKILKDDPSLRVLMAPGNAGWPLSLRRSVKATDTIGILNLCKDEHVDFAVVGPEDPLALGLVDILETEGIATFGPTKAAAQLESSKLFAKLACEACEIPTAEYRVARTFAEASHAISQTGFTVVKADGLCAGKGVEPAKYMALAIEFARKLLVDKIHGSAGELVLIEEKLAGEERTVMFICDGKNAIPLPCARDYKRRYDHDKGLNTGGMGAYAPTDDSEALSNRILSDVVMRILAYMEERGMPFRGILYVGIMLVRRPDGERMAYVLEFNVRGGDPETEAIMAILASPLLPYLVASRKPGGLAELPPLKVSGEYAVVVAGVQRQYPEPCRSGVHIVDNGRDKDYSFIFHAGTDYSESGQLVAVGGRVAYGVGVGPTLYRARSRAYDRIILFTFQGKEFRKDIAQSGAT